jgi:hypothetical protein
MLATEFEKKLAFDLRASWQVKTLGEAQGTAFAVVLSVLGHSFPEALPVVMHLLIPDWDGKAPGPYLISCGKIAKTGFVVADVVDPKTGAVTRDAMLYASEIALRDDMRRLADKLKLVDRDRMEFFTAIKNWVVADRRLDPTFDPKDPDAKRLILH